jgi:class 3 adenylate cyclase
MRTLVGSEPGVRTRGFLFADLRGYTQFVERAGAAAGVALLERYRALVREVVAHHRGAEIRTEGDSFYVVLPTASAAVECGLSIVESARRAAEASWTDPLRIGVGIHAGEAIESDQGMVGSAVNIAARVCALAGPGEVLVSETVRSLTRSVLPVQYVSRGRRRLKGVAEPVALFRAVPPGAEPARTGRRWVVVAVAVVLLLVVLALVAIALGVIRLPVGV